MDSDDYDVDCLQIEKEPHNQHFCCKQTGLDLSLQSLLTMHVSCSSSLKVENEGTLWDTVENASFLKLFAIT